MLILVIYSLSVTIFIFCDCLHRDHCSGDKKEKEGDEDMNEVSDSVMFTLWVVVCSVFDPLLLYSTSL